jgi:hypothetical protein
MTLSQRRRPQHYLFRPESEASSMTTGSGRYGILPSLLKR